MFTTAFSLETITSSRHMWAKLSVGIALAMMILLISWCTWPVVAARTNFSASGAANCLTGWLINFTRDMRGKTLDSEPDAGDSKRRKLYRSGTLKEAFNFIRARRRSTSSTLVNAKWTGSNGSCASPPGSTEAEVGETNNKESESAV